MVEVGGLVPVDGREVMGIFFPIEAFIHALIKLLLLNNVNIYII